MSGLLAVLVVVVVLGLLGLALSVRVVKQYERGVLSQVQEPSLRAQAHSQPATQPDSHARSQRSGQLLPGGSPW